MKQGDGSYIHLQAERRRGRFLNVTGTVPRFVKVLDDFWGAGSGSFSRRWHSVER